MWVVAPEQAFQIAHARPKDDILNSSSGLLIQRKRRILRRQELGLL